MEKIKTTPGGYSYSINDKYGNTITLFAPNVETLLSRVNKARKSFN